MQTSRSRTNVNKRSHKTTKSTPRPKTPTTASHSTFSTTAPAIAPDSTPPSTHVHPKKQSKGKTQTVKSTAQYDSLVKRNPMMKHSEELPDIPVSSLPEDQHYPTYRTYIRQCADTITRVRQHNVEPYSYSHQIFAAHSVDPTNYGEGAKQLVRPARLVLDGPEGIEALAYYDQAVSMPANLDPSVSELKSYSKFLLTQQSISESDILSQDTSKSHITTNSGLKSMQKAALPTSIHTNSLVVPTTHFPTAPSSPDHQCHEPSDVQLTKQRYDKHLEYAEVSSAIKNVAYWGPESGSVDSIIGQHYAVPGMLVATTSQRSLGYVAAMGGISVKVSPAEAAGLLAGQPMYHFQPQNPVLVNLHGILGQWISPQDVIAVIVQYLGELGFNSAFGLQQPVSVEITDKGNQFSLDQLATICSTVGSLPNVASITVPTNASQFQYLRDTNRGAFNRFIYEYGAQLLEPDHQVKYTETVDINLSKLMPTVSVHNAMGYHALNTVSCPLDYLDVMTGENPSKQLNLSKLTHIDNIAYHPAMQIDSFHDRTGEEFFVTNPKTGRRHRVVPNRYHYLRQTELGERMEKALSFEKYKDSKIVKSIGKMTKKFADPEAKDDDENDRSNENKGKVASSGPEQQQDNIYNTDAPRLTIDDVQIAPNVATVGLSSTAATSKSINTIDQISNSNQSPSQSITQPPSKTSKSLFSRPSGKTDPNTNPPTTQPTTTSSSHHARLATNQTPQQHSQASFWPEKPNIILIRGGYVELKQSLKIWLQCLQEGMKPRVATLLQPDTPQTLALLRQSPDLCDENGTNVLTLIEQFFPLSLSVSSQVPPVSQVTTTPSTPAIKILTPGTGAMDYLLSDFIITQESLGLIPSRAVEPTILTTDLGLSQADAGLSHYTPHLFTSSNEHTALTTFTGNLSFDPINHTLSPQHCKFHPDDHNSFFLLPSNGVEPEIDPDSGKLKVPSYLTDSGYQLRSLTAPNHSLPSNNLKTEFHLSRRLDLQFQVYNTRYKEHSQINRLPRFEELCDQLGQPLETDLEKTISDQHESMNTYLFKPIDMGYSTAATRLAQRNLSGQSTSQLMDSIVNPLSQSITHTYPSTWWDNNNIVDMPVLCNLNLSTSAADLAGLDNQLRFTPHQQQFLSKSGLESTHLVNWLRAKFTSPDTNLEQNSQHSRNSSSPSSTLSTTTSSTLPADSTTSTNSNADLDDGMNDSKFTIFSDILLRRLQATPRHLKYVFPFSNTQLQLRYALSGIKSSMPGAMSAMTKPEFISTTQPPSDGATSNASIMSSTNSLGFGLGMKLQQLVKTGAQSSWTAFTSSLCPSGSQSSNNSSDSTEIGRHGVDYLSKETNLLWATSDESTVSTHQNVQKSSISNDFMNHMMPSVRTYLKLPQGRTFHESKSPAAQLSLPHSQSISGNMHFAQTLAWNYFINGTKWAIVADGLSPKVQQRIQDSSRNTDLELDNTFRWDQNGFGFGTPEDCDQAVRGLKLLGCGAVLSSKINANFMRALNNHGILGLHFTTPSTVQNINITDSVTIMTHREVPPEEDEGTGEKDGNPSPLLADPTQKSPETPETSPTPPKRTELFLPHQSPVVVRHHGGNRPAVKTTETDIVETLSLYDAHSLLWFRAGNVVNAGVEQQLRTQLVDKALQFNASVTNQQQQL